jgi:putrescine transport system permease protein
MKRFHKALLLLIAGYVFLYLPLIIVVVYSFNKSPVMSVWQGFSWKWYHQLFENDALFSSDLASLKIG